MAKKETKKSAPKKAAPKKVAAPRKKAAPKKVVASSHDFEDKKTKGFINPFTISTEQIAEAKRKVELGKFNNDLRDL